MNSISGNEKNSKYLILNSSSWIKGTSQCVEYAKANGIDYELVNGLSYHELLIKMSTSRGLIFRPLGGDTCPRIVIEAKLLGCEILMNDNVQHRFEGWFSTKESCEKYLKCLGFLVSVSYFGKNIVTVYQKLSQFYRW